MPDWSKWLQHPLAGPVAGGLVLLFCLALLIRLLRRKPAEPGLEAPDLSLDVRSLHRQKPALSGAHLEVYGVPVHLSVVVLAPVGRDQRLPPTDQLPALLGHLLPHLQQVVESDRPLLKSWPTQLSVQGFKHAFFNQVMLPGDRGKGTPWCSVAGRFSIGSTSYLVGLAGCAASDNSLGQVFVDHEGRWLDAVRVKNAAGAE